nr:hypothetical protein [Tanacetum cinerariifolium]
VAQNPRVQNDEIQNQIRNGNLVVVRAEGNAARHNGNQIRDAAYLQTQLLIAQKEEAGIQLQAEEYDLMATAAYLYDIEEVNANCILMANLQQASTSGTQSDSTPIYDTYGSAEHDPPVVHDSEETLELAQESHDKMKQMNKEIKPANYTKINHLLGVFVPQKAFSLEELFFSNNSKTANVSKSFLIPNEDLSDNTTPSVARKFLNEVKSTILTLQRVVKQRMTIETHNWVSSAHQELHKIIREENFPIVNQVDARLQNFEIQFLKKAAKFVGDFKSLAKEADDSLAKHKAMELDNECVLKAVVSQDVVNIVQKESAVVTSDLQTELERTKERFENCIIKKETEYAKLWNDWYKKCNECKYDKISNDKAYKDMQQKIERLQAQLGDLKSKCKDTSHVSDTRNPLSQKLENKNVELESQVLNYARENAHLKASYKNLFDSMSMSHAQTKTIIDSLQNELQSNIYKIAKLRTQLFKKASDHKDNTQNTSANTKFAKQPIGENFPKVGKTNALSKPVTSNSVSSSQEPKGVDNTKTRRPKHRSNKKHDRAPLRLRVDVISKVVCAVCKKCLISVNHDKCLCIYMNGKIPRGTKQTAKVFVKEIQKNYQPKIAKPKKIGTRESLATPKPSKSGFILRWSPTGYSDLFMITMIETMNVSFDELSAMAFEQRSSKPRLQIMTSRHISSGLDLTYAPSTITTQQPSEGELDLLFEAMYDDYFGGQPSATARTIPPVQEPQVRQTSTASTIIADIASIPTNSSSHATNILITSQDVDEFNSNAMVDGNTFVNPFANLSTSVTASSSSQNVDPSNMHTFYQPYPYEF